MPLEFPPIYLLSWGFEKDPHELHRLEKRIGVVWDIKEADLVLGKLTKKTRAEHELRKLGLITDDVDEDPAQDEKPSHVPTPPKKKRKLDTVKERGREVICVASDTESSADEEAVETDTLPTSDVKSPLISSTGKANKPLVNPGTIKVLRHVWYSDSLEADELLPVEKYLVYEGRIIAAPKTAKVINKATILPSKSDTRLRAQPDTPPSSSHESFRRHGHQRSPGQTRQPHSQPASLLHETTEDHENLPPIPEYLNTRYSCERPTPLHCPNEAFLAQLRIMQKGRMLLEKEDMRARAYNSAIATIASYPYTITSPFELMRLPNCGESMASKWQDWRDTGHIPEVEAFLADEKFKSLSLFYDIHDVGFSNALKFWKNGWRELDDIIEHGWNELTRNQQIGLKYREEFLERIPRTEVERIAGTVLQYANRIHTGFQMVICGGYRRGKADCGDVDVILSHPDEEATDFVLGKLLESLEDDGYITHRLEYALTNSKRGQTPLKWRGYGPRVGGGFDTLDHAFVVWQDPSWPTEEEDLKVDPDASNPNVHRRVDIIVSPWKTAGCAVLGWTGATMFERDLRSYSRKKLGWKFDSSGVRDVATGEWIDLEAGAEDMLAKERKIFEGMKLEWREPTERCTD